MQQFICLNCGMKMVQRQCKIRCPRCGYFEDCSDGGNDQTNVIVRETSNQLPVTSSEI